MSKRTDSKSNPNVPISRQTAGGVAGAVVGGMVAGPLGAVIGGVAGAAMGNRSAAGESPVPDELIEGANAAVKKVRAAVPAAKARKVGKAVKGMKRTVSKIVKTARKTVKKVSEKASRKASAKKTGKATSSRTKSRSRGKR